MVGNFVWNTILSPSVPRWSNFAENMTLSSMQVFIFVPGPSDGTFFEVTSPKPFLSKKKKTVRPTTSCLLSVVLKQQCLRLVIEIINSFSVCKVLSKVVYKGDFVCLLTWFRYEMWTRTKSLFCIRSLKSLKIVYFQFIVILLAPSRKSIFLTYFKPNQFYNWCTYFIRR